ncbi:restriction endonuclease subunit S [Citrobacter sedlakii]|nr:restriction endonuclease subunit S [Citrobacter sedlakii]
MSFSFYKTTIGEQVTLQRGFDITKKNQVEGNIPVVSSGGISSYHNEAKVSGPGVVLGRKGSLGTVFYIDGPYWPHDTTLWVKDFKNNNPTFVYYFFKNISQLLKDMDVGAANPALNRNHVHPLEVLWPNRKTQDHIAGILASLDVKINNNTKVNKTLEQMAQALFKSWFIDFEPVKAKIAMLESGGSQEEATLAAMTAISGKDTDSLAVFERKHPVKYAELRATAELFPSAMQENESGGIPEGWALESLGTILEPKKGKNITKKTIEEGGIPVVAGGLVPAYYHSKYNVTAPVITISASGANAGFVNLYHCNIWASDCSYINKIQTQFVYCFYTLLKIRQREITHMQQGAAQPHVYPKDIMRLNIVTPITALWQKLEEILTSIYEKVGVNTTQNMYLEQLRDTLLPKLLSGEITLPEAEELAKEADYV